MDEPTSSHLFRSLSSPTFDTSSSSLTQSIGENGEVNPMRTFAESISFGRFMSDSLDWERWSAFTHKRYVEEAEKYSKPGSVAAKRAYFEAHYKRKALEKTVTALSQESNAQANGTSGFETLEGNRTYASVAKKSKVNNIVEQPYFEAHYMRKGEEKAAAAALTPEANTRANGTSDSGTLEGNRTYASVVKKSKVDNIVVQPYFEAHYKRKDEEKAAAALKPEANTRANGTSHSESQERNNTDSSIEKRPKVENIVEQPYFKAHYNRKDEEKAAAALTPEANTQANGTSYSESREVNHTDSSIEKRPKVDNIVEQPYFEAHYNRKDEEKAAAALKPEANTRADGTSNSESCREGNHTDSSIEKRSKVDKIVEQPDKDDVNYQIAVNDDTMQYKCDVGQNGLNISNVEEVAEDMARTCVDTNLVSNSTNEIAVPTEERIPDPGTAGHEVSALPVKGKEVNPSAKLPTKTTAAKLSHPLDKRKGAAAMPPLKSGSKGKTSGRNPSETTRLTTGSVHLSVNLPSGTATSKIAAAAEKSRKGINSVPKGKKSVGGSFEMKELTGRSIHRSINLPSGIGTSKTAAAAEKSIKGINSVSKSKKSVGGSVETKGLTGRSIHRSINLPAGTGTSKTAAAAEKSRKGINSVSKGKKSVGGSVETKGLTARSLHKSINLPSGTGTSKTAAATAKSRKDINSVSKSKKSVGGSVETKGQNARSLHRPINLPSGTGTRKTAAATEKSRKDINNVSKSKKSVGGSVETKRLTSQSLSGTGTRKTVAAAKQPRNSMNSVSKSNKSVRGSVETKGTKGLTAPRSSHISMNLPSGAGGSRKTATTTIKPRNGMNNAANTTKTARDSVVKRPAARSLHMSIDLPSGASLTSKTALVLENNNKSKRVHSTLPSVSKHNPVASPTSAKASHGFSSPASAKPPPQGRRTERLLNKSVTGGVTANAKLSSGSVALKSSSLTKSNQGSRTISSLSKSRSGEREVKRTEDKNTKRVAETNNRTRQSATSSSNLTRENASPNIQH